MLGVVDGRRYMLSVSRVSWCELVLQPAGSHSPLLMQSIRRPRVHLK